MSNQFPDFSSHPYRIEQELGHNRAGGRVTYLATDTQTQQPVVIKQFQFAKAGASWAEFDAHDREIQLLKDLDHPGIPRYLQSFQTEDGFCMVQEYKPAESLAGQRSFHPEAIRQIAIAALEVLVYLQNRVPPVIHRDIKPENILVDEQGQVFLVDFGFARVGEGEVGVSSVVKGTLGFMPPEQLFNRQLTEASDLYGLGMTLICLLTATKSDRIGDLVDISYRVSFRHLVTKLNLHWVNWLEKMVEPRLKDRFPNALAALAAVPRSPLRPPEAQVSRSTLEYVAVRSGEVLSQSLTVTNPIPDTLLEGQWQIATHAHDPDASLYQWISIEPAQFAANQVECQVWVDTRRLIAGKTYTRTLLLRTNTLANTITLTLHVRTAPSRAVAAPAYGILVLLGGFAIVLSWFTNWVVLVLGIAAESAESSTLGTLLGGAIGLEAAAWLLCSSGWRMGASTATIAAVTVGALVFVRVVSGTIAAAGPGIIFSAVAGITSGTISGLAIGTVVEKLLVRGMSRNAAIGTTLLVSLLGASLGLCLIPGLVSAATIAVTLTSTLILTALLIHCQLQRAAASLAQRQAEQHLIKP